MNEEAALKEEVEQKHLAPEGRLQNMGYSTPGVEANLEAARDSLGGENQEKTSDF